MAKPGPKPKPTKLKVIEGNRGKRRLKEEPEPADGRPRMPAWLPAESKTEWKRLAPELERLGLLTSIDGGAFTAAVLCYGLAVRAAKELARDGTTTEDERGLPRKHPAHQILRDNLAAYRQWCAEFGLTPASRASLGRETPKDDPADWLTATGR